MIDSGQSNSILKRTLVYVGAMLGASFVFVAAFTLLLTIIADRAISPPQTSKVEDRAASTAATAATSTAGAKPATGAPKVTGGRS